VTTKYNVYVLFNDPDAEPLGVEEVIDFQNLDVAFFMIDIEGRRWFLPLTTIRWVEVTPMEES